MARPSSPAVPPRSPRRSERGEGHIKLFIVLVIFGVILFAAFRVVPPYINNYQLQDTCESESRLFAAHQKNDIKVRDSVWADVQSMSLPITQDQIKVEVFGKTARVSIEYSVTVNIFGYDYTINFHPEGESPIM